MSKMSRRTTRDRLIDLLEEAIKLVKVRCVGPEGSDQVLEEAKKEFQEAADMKNQAAELLKTVREATPYPQNQLTTNGLVSEPLTLAPQPNRNTTLKVKKLPSCPGGPKAFNEFLKSKRGEVEANLGPNAKYADVRAEIAKRWKQACNKNTKKVSKKKTTMTPGRVNAPIPFNTVTVAPEPIELPVPEDFQGSNYQAPEAPEANYQAPEDNYQAPEAPEANYQENIEETPAPV